MSLDSLSAQLAVALRTGLEGSPDLLEALASSLKGIEAPLTVTRASKDSVNYRPADPETQDRRCERCDNYLSNQKRCQIVEGAIAPLDVCDRYAQKTSKVAMFKPAAVTSYG